MRMRLAVFGGLLFVGYWSCGGYTVRPSDVSLIESSIEAPRRRVFDAALAAANQLNLDVKVLEKDSGLLRFERAFLTATQLDQYCVYPFEPVGCRADGYGSFEMHQNYEQAPVSGEVSLTVLMSELTPARTELEMRSNWKAVFQGTSHYSGVYQLETKGILEDEFRSRVLAELQSPRTGPA